MRVASIMFLFALLLQGCGHKGPLSLPKPQEQPASLAATQQPQSNPSR